MKVTSRGVAALVAVCGTVGCGVRSGPMVRDHEVVERGTAATATVSISMGAGDLDVKSGATALMEADFAYNVARLKPEIEYEVTGSDGVLRLSQNGGPISGNYENRWTIGLQDAIPMSLNMKLGAGDARFSVGRLNLTRLDISMGAGDLVLDLAGSPARSYRVNVLAGAGDTTVHVPATVAISASVSGAIGDVTVTGLEKQDDRWVNPRVRSSAVTIELNLKHAIGDLKLIAE